MNRVTFHVQGFLSALRSKAVRHGGRSDVRELSLSYRVKGTIRVLGRIKQRGLIPA